MPKAKIRQELQPKDKELIDSLHLYDVRVLQAQCLTAHQYREKKNTSALIYYKETIGAPVPRAKVATSKLTAWACDPENADRLIPEDIEAFVLLMEINKEEAAKLYTEHEGYWGLHKKDIFDKVMLLKERAPRGDTLSQQVAKVMLETGWETKLGQQILGQVPSVRKALKKLLPPHTLN